ncbi:MAG: glycosyltransferase family 2 protein [Egibacteraceae bacterium]
MSAVTPTFSVCIATHNRARQLLRAIDTVLAQTIEDFEIVVVDDGSEDDTYTVVTGIDDQRVRYLFQPNSGLAATRNRGAQEARGRVLVFLDDDDEVLSEWLDAFTPVHADSDCAIACCGVTIVNEEGVQTGILAPRDLGPAFDGQYGLYLAGAFAVRRDAFEAVGGFATDIPTSHQTELWLRLVPYCTANSLTVHSIDRPLLRILRRSATGRPRNRPELLYTATSRILSRHRDRLARDPELLADYLAVCAVCAARLRRVGEARRLLWQAVRAAPRRPKHYARLAVATVPPVARRVWG